MTIYYPKSYENMSVVFIPLSSPVAGEETRGNLIRYNTLRKLDRSTNDDINELLMRGNDLEILEVDESELQEISTLGTGDPNYPPVEIKEITQYKINLGKAKSVLEWEY